MVDILEKGYIAAVEKAKNDVLISNKRMKSLRSMSICVILAAALSKFGDWPGRARPSSA